MKTPLITTQAKAAKPPPPFYLRHKSLLMRLGVVSFLAFACAAVVKHDDFAFNGISNAPPQKALAEIPGNSPIQTCLDDEPQLVDIELVSLEPNPPIPGENLTVTAKGTLKKDLVDGSYVDVLVRYGFITLVSRRYDLCELMPEVDLECPLNAGYLSLTRSVEIPEEAPPGTYSVEAKAYTPEEELLTCLTAVVTLE